MCSCNRYRPDQQNINYTYSYLFDDCKCFEDHEIFVVRCQMCLYNLVGFMMNYFCSICCGCVYLNKNVVCVHCKRLRDALNSNAAKVCLKQEDLPKEFKLIEINKYLEKPLRANPISYYLKGENQIKLSVDSLDWRNFLMIKKLCELFFIFRTRKK